MEVKENIRGLDYLNLALLAFAGLGLELVLIFIEPLIYGQSVEFDSWTAISHWILTCIAWGTAVVMILRYAKKRYGFNIRGSGDALSPLRWVTVAALVVLSVFISYQTRGGFKLQIEFNNLGAVKFIFQHIYYFFETCLFTLIIAFGQKAFEKWFKNENIPYGGIICALTWGFAHIFTKSSLGVGLISAIWGFGFGAVYLLLGRDVRKTFPAIFLMFVL